jgi:CBS domain-containing protein
MACGDGGRLIEEIMSPPPGVLHSSDTLERAANLLAGHRAPLLPVLSDDESLVGIITRRDLLSAYRSAVSL